MKVSGLIWATAKGERMTLAELMAFVAEAREAGVPEDASPHVGTSWRGGIKGVAGSPPPPEQPSETPRQSAGQPPGDRPACAPQRAGRPRSIRPLTASSHSGRLDPRLALAKEAANPWPAATCVTIASMPLRPASSSVAI